MKFYFPKDHYNASYRRDVFPLLKPFIKSKGFTDEERMAIYGVSNLDFEFTDVIENSNIVILTMSWNYYHLTNTLDLAEALIEKAKNYSKVVWAVNLNDVGVQVPKHSNLKVFRLSGSASRLPSSHIGMPVFINDPLKTHFDTMTIIKRAFSNKPTIGFCGLASKNMFRAFKRLSKIAIKNIAFHLNCYSQPPEQFISAPYLRYQCLKTLKNHKEINDNFIIRNQYRAGSTTDDERKTSTLEFYKNIKNSDYVLCVRGAGNFSVRLYETLAMGRIPVYINTDGLLPLHEKIFWKNHMVWVEKNEIPIIAEKIIAFHQQLNQIKLNDLFKANRELWEYNLRLKPFFLNHI